MTSEESRHTRKPWKWWKSNSTSRFPGNPDPVGAAAKHDPQHSAEVGSLLETNSPPPTTTNDSETETVASNADLDVDLPAKGPMNIGPPSGQLFGDFSTVGSSELNLSGCELSVQYTALTPQVNIVPLQLIGRVEEPPPERQTSTSSEIEPEPTALLAPISEAPTNEPVADTSEVPLPIEVVLPNVEIQLESDGDTTPAKVGSRLRSVSNLRYALGWLAPTGLLATEIIVIALSTATLISLHLSRQIQLAVLAGMAILIALLWRWIRIHYWRSGDGRKVGISYDSTRTPLRDWVEMKREFSRHFESFPDAQKINLKMLPLGVTRTEKRKQKTSDRYRIPLIFRVNLSQGQGALGQRSLQIRYAPAFPAELAKEFSDRTDDLAMQLFQQPPTEKIIRMLQLRAASLSEVTLLHLAVIEIAQQRFKSASQFLRRLDDSLAARCAIDEQPRLSFRWFIVACLINQSIFPGDSPPKPSELMQATQLCREAAASYGQEFPFIYTSLARNFVYLHALEAAGQAIESALVPSTADQYNGAIALINKAAILVLMEMYGQAAAALCAFRSLGQSRMIQWKDLIGFADYAHSYGYPSAVYLQALYRRMAGEPITGQLATRLNSWIAADPAREELRSL